MSHLSRSNWLQAPKNQSKYISNLISGIQTPAIYFVDHEKSCIYMEYIENCITVRDFITNILKTQRSNYMELLRPLVETIGTTLSKMHEKNIIHGDLTTSNMLLRNDPNELDLVLIDFGLGYVENLAEDKGVDLYVLERAFLSTHPNTEKLFEILIKSYANYNKNTTAEVISKLDEVRMRGRKRTMVGWLNFNHCLNSIKSL